MLFTEPASLFVFLPLVLAMSRFASRAVGNYLLLALSLLFYAVGEPQHVPLLVLSSLLNYLFGILLEDRQRPGLRKLACGLGVGCNLALLGFWKYSGFLADNLNLLLGLAGDLQLQRPEIELPLGISFFTFQGLSYLLDVYSGQVKAERNPAFLGLYISLFPQLIAGPIVRFSDVAADLRQREATLDDWSEGIRQFILGCARKLLIANPVAETADAIFSLSDSQLSMPLAWVGLLAYAFQIYFDFSGYSAMASGLGRMLGFRFPQNFNDPYTATSVRDFWRRWHISLSTWFRDYLYVPLGGNRVSPKRTTINLMVVFLLCGLWHGASWNFVVWGGIHGTFLTLERHPRLQWLPRTPGVNRIYTLIVVLTGWVFFRCETLSQSMAFLHALVAGDSAGLPISLFVSRTGMLAFVVAAVWSTPAFTLIGRRLNHLSENRPGRQLLFDSSMLTVLCGILLLSVSQAAANTFNPFIYFRF